MEKTETTADWTMEAIVTTLQTVVHGNYRNYCRLDYGGYANDPANCAPWKL